MDFHCRIWLMHWITKCLVKHCINKKISTFELANIKKQYGISMQAIVMRANECGIINDQYKNWRVDEPAEYQGAEESDRFEQLLFRALIEDQISMSKAASLSNRSLAKFKKEYQPMF
jgi:Zn-dependent peptidase ImmA (M78 family)